MFELPLHPKLVHLPLGLAIILPFVLGFLQIGIWRKWFEPRVWWVGAILCGFCFLGSVVATKSGGDEWSHVEKIVGEQALEAHAEAGEHFRNLMFVVLSVVVAGLITPSQKLKNIVYTLAVFGSLGALFVGAYAGHLGGQLVYQKGGASAYQAVR